MPLPSSRSSLRLAGTVLAALCLVQAPAGGQVLFDNTKAETAGNADWIIDTTQPVPTPSITGITSSTSESYWTGALSSWGVALAKLLNSGQISLAGNGLETLPSSGSITYGNSSNSQDLSHYQVYVVCEPNIQFTAAEKTAIVNFVKNGGGLFMVADHTGSDRNRDGWDSLMVWNDLMTNNAVQNNPFGFIFNSADVSPSSTSVDSSPSDPLINGIGGTVTKLTYSDGTTMTINNTTTTHAAVWTSSSTTGVMALYGTYGSGRFAAIGDSSVVEDATSSSGKTYAGWTTPVDNGYCAINGTVWLLGSGTSQTPPTATTGTATSVGMTNATLNGTVNPNGQSTTVLFQYGPTISYGSTAAVSGSLTGTSAQAVSVNISNLTAGATYHLRVTAANAAGTDNGLDQTFTTSAAATADLTIATSHTGNFTQGDTADVYTITVTNVGSLATSGTVTVIDTLPASLTATNISGTGWTANLSTRTCTRSDALAGGTNYPPITVTVKVATNAPASVTNTATVSGGGDTNSANNTASDVTIINTSGGAGGATNVVISQFYGPGGNASDVTYKNDFVELFNPGSTEVSLSTWSVQYCSASGSSWSVVNLNGSILPYHYYLVQLGGGSYGAALPTPDATGTINISATSGKLALVSSQTALSGSNPIGSSQIVDFVGYGSANAYEGTAAAPGGADTTSTLRKDGGYTDSTNNAADFTTLTPPVARNSASSADPPAPTPVADLVVLMTHGGSFTQGDTGDSYTIIVTNIGAAATVGAVSVSDTLPAGLAVTAISGTDWTVNTSTLTCTRSDALTAGASYLPITVTVKVLSNAPTSLTNVATVSGGGETNTANNAASDPTTINPASAPTAITGTASAAGMTTAGLNGTVNPNGQPTSVHFDYGLTTGYGSTASVAGNLTGTTPQAVSAGLSGLLPATTYHVRLVATNVIGATIGQDQSFTTLAPIEAWRLQWFGTTANSGAAADTAIGSTDGMANLLKYALGLNPLVATNDPVVGDISTGYLRLTVPKNPQATDVSFHVEMTGDLTTPSWTTNGTTVDVNTPTLLQVHDNTLVISSAGGFIRLRVSRP